MIQVGRLPEDEVGDCLEPQRAGRGITADDEPRSPAGELLQLGWVLEMEQRWGGEMPEHLSALDDETEHLISLCRVRGAVTWGADSSRVDRK